VKYRKIVESALGKSLRGSAPVHHADGNHRNDDPSNLVVCPSHAYHHLIHQRTRAFLACGDANKIKCTWCEKWDDPVNINRYSYHKECWNRVRGWEWFYNKDKCHATGGGKTANRQYRAEVR